MRNHIIISTVFKSVVLYNYLAYETISDRQKGKGTIMIHPSYVDLMKVVNKDVEEGDTPVINSRYSIVMATAKRARQIVDGDEILIDAEEGEKPLSIAVEELNQGKIRILAEDEDEDADDSASGEELLLTDDDTLDLDEGENSAGEDDTDAIPETVLTEEELAEAEEE